MFFNKPKKDNASLNLTVPDHYTLHGIEIKKLPIGAYIDALATIKNLPEIVLKQCFPGMKPDQVIQHLISLDEDKLYQIFGHFVQVVPEEFLKVVSRLINVDYEVLRNNLTPKELLDVLNAFWELNDMTDFLAQAMKLVVMLSPIKALITGSNA